MSHSIFQKMSKSSETPVNSTTIKFVRGQNFSFRGKKDPGRKLNLPHKPGEARTFFASPKKDPELGRSTEATTLSPQELHILFLWGKKVSLFKPRK